MSQQSKSERAQSCLIRALEKADIPELKRDEHILPSFAGTRIYWQGTPDLQIELLLSSAHFGGGRLKCSIHILDIATRTVEVFEDDDAINALVDALNYLKVIVSTLLPTTHFDLLRRAYNARDHAVPFPLDAERFVEKLLSAYSDDQDRAKRRLRGERDKRRGGSEPKVEVTTAQCIELADHYVRLLPHWQKISRLRKTEKNWRAYAKIDEPDTPDDLLDRLDGKVPDNSAEDYPSIPSTLALEHASRRSGIPDDQYSSSRLKDFRKAGQFKKPS